MDIKNKKTKVLASLIWKLMERLGAQGVSFIVQIILGRLLMPEDFGAIAIVTVFITLSNVLSRAVLIQHLSKRKMRMIKIFLLFLLEYFYCYDVICAIVFYFSIHSRLL